MAVETYSAKRYCFVKLARSTTCTTSLVFLALAFIRLVCQMNKKRCFAVKVEHRFCLNYPFGADL
ncbi:hypothetical protein [Moraxella lacunata]|uniref:hypothetical protein n=1 Tax=Moraxella lacunata TaxID=477 RepID=UPI003EE0C91A